LIRDKRKLNDLIRRPHAPRRIGTKSPLTKQYHLAYFTTAKTPAQTALRLKALQNLLRPLKLGLIFMPKYSMVPSGEKILPSFYTHTPRNHTLKILALIIKLK